MNPDAFITSMFVRRLIILASMFSLVLAVLIGQLYRLTVLHGEELREDAERVLVERQLLPTIRGRILDRKGRVLAEDRPCFDVLVDYRVISGAWAVTQAAREAQRTLGNEWDELSRADRERIVEQQFRGKYDRMVDDLWRDIARLADIPLEKIDVRREDIQTRVERMANYIWRSWKKEQQEQFQTTLTIDDVKRPIREQQLPHVIIDRIDSSKEAAFRRLAANGPQIEKDRPAVTIQSAGTRVNPYASLDVELPRATLPGSLRNEKPVSIEVDDVASLILGSMRTQVYEEDVKRKPLKDDRGHIVNLDGYTDGDHVGATGIEAACEDELRGTRGVIIRHLDTGAEDRDEPTPGDDVQLAIDIQLQARVKAILSPAFGLTVVQPWHGHESALPDGTPLAAGAVVVDIETGDILAMVSQTPTEWEEIGTDSPDGPSVSHPAYVNRAIEKPYPCGSIIKPLMLCSGVSAGVWQPTRVVECTGHFYPNDPDHYRCWIYREQFGYATHGPLAPVEAIARSCNMYFYTLADALGPKRIAEWYGKWGVGHTFDLVLTMTPGLIDLPNDLDRGEVLMMGIGQGPVAWTPLHAATAYSALARGGYYFEPTLILNRPPSADSYRDDLQLNGRTVDLAIEGLHEVVHNQQYGGARHIDVNPDPAVANYEPILNVEGVDTWGKTGTAQHRPWPTRIFAIDEKGEVRRDKDGKPILIHREVGTGAHSWFVGMAGAKSADGRASNPQYVVAVIVEWGGSGSRCAGPIANQIMQALKDEGYFNP